jgi:glycerate 2-kinase
MSNPKDRFRNRLDLQRNDLSGRRKLILDSLNSAIDGVQPHNLVKERVSLDSRGVLTIKGISQEFPLRTFDDLIVVGAGKASGALAVALESILGHEVPYSGVVIVPKGTGRNYSTVRVKIVEGTHPVPSLRSVRAAEEVMRAVGSATDRSLVLCLISGGGSALMTLPAKGISLQDQIATTTLLLKSGATIEEVNCIRKHLSSVKGGQLAAAAKGARILSLIISDIVGNPVGSIASGPTAPDPTTFEDALQILTDRRILNKIPRRVLQRIKEGVAGRVLETPKPGSPVFEKVTNFVLGDNSIACQAAIKTLKKNGVAVICYLGSSWQGEARDTGSNLTGLILAARSSQTDSSSGRKAFVWGGETTVTVRGKGRGGRNQEEALSSLLKLADHQGIALAYMGTDGIDGFSPAAGALIDSSCYERAKSKKLDPEQFLRNNDSTSFFEKTDESLLVTGLTGTNVNDIGIAIIDPLQG